MKKILIVSLLMGITLSLMIGPLFAEIPKVIQYQGKLTDAGDVPLNEPHNLTFKIYTVSEGGNHVWSETHENVQIINGIFSVLLGNVTPLDLPFDKDYWLGIKVGGDGEMTPRQRLASVGYAYRAATADSLSGGVSIPHYISGFELDWASPAEINIMPGAIDIAGVMYTTASAANLNISPAAGYWLGSAITDGWAYVYIGALDGNPTYKLSGSVPIYSDISESQYRPRRYIKDGIRYYRCIGAVKLVSGQIIPFYQKDNTVWYEDVQQFVCGNATSWTEVNLSALCPQTITEEALILSAMEARTAKSYWRQTNSTQDIAQHQVYHDIANAPVLVGWFPMFQIPAIDYKVGSNNLTGYVSAFTINIR